MYAIVDIAGQQFKVEKDQKIFVHRLDVEEGKSVDFDKVLLIDNDGAILVGEPVVAGALVSAKVLSHLKGDKVMVFKKKRRKGYQVLNGHRQSFSEILISSIVEKGGKKAVSAEPKADEVKVEAAAKPAESKAPAAAAKKAAPKEKAPAAAKKPAATTKKPATPKEK